VLFTRLIGWIVVNRTRAETLAQQVELDSPVVVVGAGQAGLAVSHGLITLGVDHVVVERARVGETWRGLWDSFCLVTPNWTVRLPGLHYDGDQPDGYMGRDEVVAYLDRYANTLTAPVREGVEVTTIEVDPDGFFQLETSGGPITARRLVLATGAAKAEAVRQARAGAVPSGMIAGARWLLD